MGFFSRLFGSEGKKQDSHTAHTMEHHGSTSTSTIAKDPVCGMDVDVNTTAAKSEYEGKTYYFCSSACKTQFDKNPAKFIAKQGSQGHGCC